MSNFQELPHNEVNWVDMDGGDLGRPGVQCPADHDQVISEVYLGCSKLMRHPRPTRKGCAAVYPIEVAGDEDPTPGLRDECEGRLPNGVEFYTPPSGGEIAFRTTVNRCGHLIYLVRR